MKKGRPPQHVQFSLTDVAKLQTLVRKSKAPQRDVLRARIAFLAFEGLGTHDIVGQLGVSVATVAYFH